MSFGEYLSVPFLISLGITLLLVGIVGMFFTQRLQEQNHKINSMVGLVSTMAEEMNYLRGRLTQIGGAPTQINEQLSFEQNELIEVSDGEDDDDDDDEDEDEDDESSDDDEEEEEEDEKSEDTINRQSNIKVINIHDNNIEQQFEEVLEQIEEINDIDNESESQDEDDDDESESSESVNLVELDSTNDLNALDISLSNSNDKQLNLDLSVLDYKKLSLNKLRNIVTEKGLSEDANKLKKQDLLKLLEV